MYYSLRNNKQKLKIRNRTILYIILTVITVAVFSILGIKILVNVINIISDLKKSDSEIPSSDTIPPKTPTINTIPEFTSQTSFDLSGNAEPASDVFIMINNSKFQIVAGNDGNFSFKIQLIEGENKMYLYSKDQSGNTSQYSKTYSVVYDSTPPLLEIISPQNNTNLSGTKNKIIEIKGTSESGSIISKNDKFVTLSDQNTFTAKYDLTNGENIITIKSVDKSKNETIKELKINYND
jgi:hypothetical protein